MDMRPELAPVNLPGRTANSPVFFEDSMLNIKLPVPPSTNELFVYLNKKRRVPSKKYMAWRMISALMIARQEKRTFTHDVCVDLRVAPNKRRDLDNYCKATLDFLVGHNILEDDRILVSLSVTRDSTVPPTEIWITIDGETREWMAATHRPVLRRNAKKDRGRKGSANVRDGAGEGN